MGFLLFNPALKSLLSEFGNVIVLYSKCVFQTLDQNYYANIIFIVYIKSKTIRRYLGRFIACAVRYTHTHSANVCVTLLRIQLN